MRVLIGQGCIDHKMVAGKTENHTQLIRVKNSRIHIQLSLLVIKNRQRHREDLSRHPSPGQPYRQPCRGKKPTRVNQILNLQESR